MKLREKMFPLTNKTIRLIEKQLKKEGLTPKTRWYKNFICMISETHDGDTFFTVFDKVEKTLYVTCSILNERDDYSQDIGETIAINRMGLHPGFQKSASYKLQKPYLHPRIGDPPVI